MTYRGHVENGIVVLDEPVVLPDGAVVRIELEETGTAIGTTRFPLRGLDYRYDAPFDPAISEQEWTANG